MLTIKGFNKYMLYGIGGESHLTYLLTYRAADGRTRFTDGNIAFFDVGEPEDFMDAVMRHQTQFVKDNALFLEIAIPNRDNHGNLVAEWIKDTVFLFAISDAEMDHDVKNASMENSQIVQTNERPGI